MFIRELIHEIDETLDLLQKNAAAIIEELPSESGINYYANQEKLILRLLEINELLLQKPQELRQQHKLSARYKIYDKLNNLPNLLEDTLELSSQDALEERRQPRATLRLKRS